jgi:GNAT superfamily N-acetyltransferase/uncharacterized damage-inducible protein DinB
VALPLTLRSATVDDSEYLYGITESTMRGYVEATWGEWDGAAARKRMEQALAEKSVALIYLADVRVGLLRVNERPEEIFLEQLYIAPEFQRRGIGTQLVEELIRKASGLSKPLRLRVLAVNPAKRLYERLGFAVFEKTPERYFMERLPEVDPSRPKPEPWLRGPVPGIPLLLQPAAHAFVMSCEDASKAVSTLSPDQLWIRPGGAASAGFHLLHLAGSTDRLLTYARGEGLSDEQRRALAAEPLLPAQLPSAEALLKTWDDTVQRALAQLAATSESILGEPRFVGRARLPSTVLGLLFHAAEHAQRHTGQLITTAKIVRDWSG